MENVLQNINRLNRNLESIITVRPKMFLSHSCPIVGFIVFKAVLSSHTCYTQMCNKIDYHLRGSKSRSVSNNSIQVGNEFSSVEALWSQFENFMGKDGDGEAGEEGKREERGQEEGEADNTQLEERDGAGK